MSNFMNFNIIAYFASYFRNFLINKLINLSIYFTTYLSFNFVVLFIAFLFHIRGDRLPIPSLKLTIMTSCLFFLVQTSAVTVSEFMSLHTSSLYNSPFTHTCFMPHPWHYIWFYNPINVHVACAELNVSFLLLTTVPNDQPKSNALWNGS